MLQDITSTNSDAIKRIDIEIEKHKDNSIKDKIVITSMLHLYVMMGKRTRLTKNFHVLVAKACSKTWSVLYSML